MSNKKHRYAGKRPHELTMAERADRIVRTGEITIKDLRANYERGRADGIAWGYDAAYGSLMIALHNEFGFGRERLARLAMATADVQINYLTNDEVYRQLVAETGLDLPTMRTYIDNAGL